MDVQVITDRSTFSAILKTRKAALFLTDTSVEWNYSFELLDRLLLTNGEENFTGFSSDNFDGYFGSGQFSQAEDTAFILGGLAVAPLFWHVAPPQ